MFHHVLAQLLQLLGLLVCSCMCQACIKHRAHLLMRGLSRHLTYVRRMPCQIASGAETHACHDFSQWSMTSRSLSYLPAIFRRCSSLAWYIGAVKSLDWAWHCHNLVTIMDESFCCWTLRLAFLLSGAHDDEQKLVAVWHNTWRTRPVKQLTDIVALCNHEVVQSYRFLPRLAFFKQVDE